MPYIPTTLSPINALPSKMYGRLSCSIKSGNFITFHWTYYLLTCLLSSVLFWSVSTPNGSILYVDSLFMVISAMSLTGLNTLNLSTLNTCQQVFLYILTILGNPLSISVFVLYIRKRAFHKKFRDINDATRPATPGKAMRSWNNTLPANKMFSR